MGVTLAIDKTIECAKAKADKAASFIDVIQGEKYA